MRRARVCTPPVSSSSLLSVFWSRLGLWSFACRAATPHGCGSGRLLWPSIVHGRLCCRWEGVLRAALRTVGGLRCVRSTGWGRVFVESRLLGCPRPRVAPCFLGCDGMVTPYLHWGLGGSGCRSCWGVMGYTRIAISKNLPLRLEWSIAISLALRQHRLGIGRRSRVFMEPLHTRRALGLRTSRRPCGPSRFPHPILQSAFWVAHGAGNCPLSSYGKASVFRHRRNRLNSFQLPLRSLRLVSAQLFC